MERLVLLAILLAFLPIGCAEPDPKSLTVAVSIAPQRWIVQQLAGDRLEILTLVPAGATPRPTSPATTRSAARCGRRSG